MDEKPSLHPPPFKSQMVALAAYPTVDILETSFLFSPKQKTPA